MQAKLYKLLKNGIFCFFHEFFVPRFCISSRFFEINLIKSIDYCLKCGKICVNRADVRCVKLYHFTKLTFCCILCKVIYFTSFIFKGFQAL